MFEEYGFRWNPNWTGRHGMSYFEAEGNRFSFHCCTQCHLPINDSEAIRINDLLGFELPSIESLRDRLARLKAR